MATTIAGIDTEALRRYVDRVVALHEERKDLNGSIAEVYEEAKDAGLVTKHLRQVVREAMMKADERASQYQVLESYRQALGMLAGTPLGDAAMGAATDEGAARPPRRGPGRPRKAPAEQHDGNGIGEPLGAA